MNPTHTRRPEFGEPYEVAAWQYDPAAPIPVWVARNFHDIGDGLLTMLTAGGHLFIARPGDWVARIVPGGIASVVLTDIEFRLNFEPLSAPALTT